LLRNVPLEVNVVGKIAAVNDATEVFAEIWNNGFTVNGPITVKFLYYKTEDGRKVGEPIYTSEQEIFKPVLGYGVPFHHGESFPVTDNTFIANAYDVITNFDLIYYVEVIVDPSTSTGNPSPLQ
jgi:hypothetical protein